MGESNARGRTRWGRFLAAAAAGGLGVGVLLFGIQQGALAANISVAGTTFKASASKLSGTGFVQYASVDHGSEGQAHTVAVNAMRKATADDFCQTSVVDLPVVGTQTIKMTAAGKGAAQMDNFVLDLVDLNGETFTVGNLEVGVDAGQLAKGPEGAKGTPGGIGLQGDTVEVTAAKQVAWKLTAGTLRVKGLQLKVIPGKSECF
ncbi:hypothetical protein GCM10012275_14130 [Longimycelium tulufanense]|uniref:Cholesterol esterase n=1 Tax=Longimycelium tulufanense TaxID=907463 RepID=A0A8J3CC25_9PSEU|nr:DUF6230 family protein [Longimycelium tulufanense]GGM44274.1 hypothetical protein GCM10012275_14130 [Longimycelium tulufanense]